MYHDNWALLEKQLDNKYTEVTLLRVKDWLFENDFCSPIVIDIELQKPMNINDELEKRYGKLQRILSVDEAINYTHNVIVEGLEQDSFDLEVVMVRGYRND